MVFIFTALTLDSKIGNFVVSKNSFEVRILMYNKVHVYSLSQSLVGLWDKAQYLMLSSLYTGW